MSVLLALCKLNRVQSQQDARTNAFNGRVFAIESKHNFYNKDIKVVLQIISRVSYNACLVISILFIAKVVCSQRAGCYKKHHSDS
jgi:hypothetical protein